MNTAKPRQMSVKGFLHKASGKISAVAFLAQHRAWLETGDLAEVTSPILRLLDEEQLLPTPALEQITKAVLTHHLRVEADKAEKKLMQSLDQESNGQVSKPWIARIFDKVGNLVQAENTKGAMVDLEQSFALASDADRWTDRRLFEGAPDHFGVIQHATITRAVDGEPITTVVLRDDAIARILKRPKGAVTKGGAKSAQKLSFGVKVKQSRAVFSNG